VPLPYNWTTVINSAEFGTDYYARTAVAKSNTFINRPRETRYFYQDLDIKGERLNGADQGYTVTFKEVPPRQRFLVDHPLRHVPLLRAERAQPLLARHQEQGIALRSRRLPHHLCAKGAP
jgi:hypothetical protein